jgi:hypothetical protein
VTRNLDDDVEYPNEERYSAQWVTTEEDNVALQEYPTLGNSDMAFDVKYRDDRSFLPSPLMLHYRYGVAALRSWGRELSVLSTHSYKRPPPNAGQNLSPPSKPLAVEGQRRIPSKSGGSREGCGQALSQATPVDTIKPSAHRIQGVIGTLPENLEEEPKPFLQDVRDVEGETSAFLEGVPEAERMVAMLWLSTPYARRVAHEEEEFKRSRIEAWRGS